MEIVSEINEYQAKKYQKFCRKFPKKRFVIKHDGRQYDHPEGKFRNIHHSRKDYREEYLKSEHWILKSKEIKLRDPICRICDKDKTCDVHHLTYENMYNEQDADLIGVCRKCHNKIHSHRILSDIKDLEKLKQRISTFKTKHRINFDDVEKYRKVSLYNQGKICSILETRGDFGSLVGISISYKKWTKIKRFLNQKALMKVWA